jgi:hypothetical protein
MLQVGQRTVIKRPSRVGGSVPPRRPNDKRKRMGAHSALIDRGAIGGKINGTSREGRFLLAYERMLTEHIGKPTILQKAMIHRACRLALHLELLDEGVFTEGKGLSQHAYQHYCSWNNSLIRTLVALGMKPGTAQEAQSPRLADYLGTGTAKRPVGRPPKVARP